MKAIVCDKCGKVNLLEDEKSYLFPSGVFRIISDKTGREIDLCEDCVDELLEGIRKEVLS